MKIASHSAPALIDERRTAASSAFGPGAPWPRDHVPGEGVETKLWMSYADLARDPTGRLSIRGVARHAGVSPTPIATDVCKMQMLRDAIMEAISARKPSKTAIDDDPDAVQAAAQAHRMTRITYWQRIAQRADSIIGEYEARAIRAEAKSRRSTGLLKRILDDMKNGRLVPGDPDAVTIAELVALLGAPAKIAQKPDDLDVE